jgi:probable phosphoglycerate mutase
VIVLIRHGQSTTNAAHLLAGRSDPDLTALGERQATALAPYLAGVREVWTSPLRRARRTAQLALPSIEASVCESFVEVDYGNLEGQPLSSVAGEQWRAFESDHARPLGDGESLADLDRRVHARLEQLLGDPLSLLHDPERHLAIVSHVSPIKSAVTWALGVSGSVAWRTRLDNGSITTIAMRRGVPALVRFNAVPLVE